MIFLVLLFVNILNIIKSQGSNEFTIPNEEEIVHLEGSYTFLFHGLIRILSLGIESEYFIIYTFISENIEKDEKGNYINYKKHFEVDEKEEIEIFPEEKYIVLIGNGSLSFSTNGYKI